MSEPYELYTSSRSATMPCYGILPLSAPAWGAFPPGMHAGDRILEVHQRPGSCQELLQQFHGDTRYRP